MSLINQLRAVHDEKHKKHFDRQMLTMQKETTKINSEITVRKKTEKGCVIHEKLQRRLNK